LPVRLVDTAGLRESRDEVERLGIAASRRCADEADVILLVLDGLDGCTREDRALLDEFASDRVLWVWNKSDLARPDASCASAADMVCVSARTGEGLDDLAAAVRRKVLKESSRDRGMRADGLSPNLRQAGALSRALDELQVCAGDIQRGLPYDICALHLDAAGAALADLTGLDGSDALLRRIFSTFCIGK
jgi:tRNA modification GTPase